MRRDKQGKNLKEDKESTSTRNGKIRKRALFPLPNYIFHH
jgi:hypothetical protein